jgi:hypothetical protein
MAKAIEIYRKYRHKEVSTEVLERLKQFLPFKRYEEIRKYQETVKKTKVAFDEVIKDL